MRIAHPIFNIVSALSILLITTTMAQTYRWQATMVDSVTRDGFYNIVVQPGIGAKLKNDLSDIRILDKDNYQVPFILKKEQAYFSEERFTEYPIVSKQVVDGCCTKLVIKNPGKKAINNICMMLKNSDAVKVTRISGSDDGQNWYGVKRFDVFYNNYSETDTRVVNYINFPLTDYQFYQLEIIDRGYWDEERWIYWHSDRWSYPVNILKVGFYESYTREGKYLSVPAPLFEQADSAKEKKTYIRINFEDRFLVDRIRFQLVGPRYYKRSATLARKITPKPEKGTSGRLRQQPTYYQTLETVELNSYSLNEFNLNFREKELYLIIENDDNRPLQLGEIECWQLIQYMKTYLEKGQRYKLVYGDSAAVAPVYDLRFFADSIPEILTTLPVASIQQINFDNRNIKVKTVRETQWYENKVFIWIAIGAVVLLLFFMSYKMLTEMKQGRV